MIDPQNTLLQIKVLLSKYCRTPTFYRNIVICILVAHLITKDYRNREDCHKSGTPH